MPVSVTWDAGIFPGGAWVQIPGTPPSINDWTKWPTWKQTEYKHELYRNVWLLALAKKLPRFETATMQTTYYFRTERERDSGNYGNHKWVTDAIKNAGVIAEDNARVLKELPPIFLVDRERPRTEVKIWEGMS